MAGALKAAPTGTIELGFAFRFFALLRPFREYVFGFKAAPHEKEDVRWTYKGKRQDLG